MPLHRFTAAALEQATASDGFLTSRPSADRFFLQFFLHFYSPSSGSTGLEAPVSFSRTILHLPRVSASVRVPKGSYESLSPPPVDPSASHPECCYFCTPNLIFIPRRIELERLAS